MGQSVHRKKLFQQWGRIPCCLAFNQMDVGVVFTVGGRVQFVNQKMSGYFRRKAGDCSGQNWYDLFAHNQKLVKRLKSLEKCLRQSECCCFFSHNRIFDGVLKERFFRIMMFWVQPKEKRAGICWVFRDITDLIKKQELARYEKTSMRVFELLRQLDIGIQNKFLIFHNLLREILYQYHLKTALFFERKKNRLFCSFGIGDVEQFPYRFQSMISLPTNLQESVAYQALIGKKTVCCPDISCHPFYAAYLKQPNEKNVPVSTCAFPVIIGSRVEGVLSLYSYDVDFFSPAVVAQLKQLIREICLYMEEARIKLKHQQSLDNLHRKLADHIHVLEQNKAVVQEQLAETNRILADLILARNQAEAATRSKMNFLANISHELRTPLNAILGFTQIINAETFGPIGQVKYKEYMGFIQRSAYHLLGLINDILDLSRIDAGKGALSESVVSLRTVLQETLDLIMQYPDASQRLIQLHLEKDVCLCADERVLKQIFLNVLSNAIKFTRKNGKIDIWVVQNETDLVIRVQDDGIGIPAEKVSSLFQPFTQVENVLTRSHQGSGLGLVLVKKMVILHQGSVELESEEGKGTSLIIHFPLSRIVT